LNERQTITEQSESGRWTLLTLLQKNLQHIRRYAAASVRARHAQRIPPLQLYRPIPYCGHRQSRDQIGQEKPIDHSMTR